jgi:hypothetical protein
MIAPAHFNSIYRLFIHSISKSRYVSAVLCVLFCVAGPCCSVAHGALCWQLLWVFFESLILTIKLLCNAVTTKYYR